MNVLEHVSLAPYTTLGVGGEARFFIEVQSVEELIEAIAFAKSKQLSLFVLGGGSNILISDEGFTGMVLHLQLAHLRFEVRDDAVLVTADAGVVWDELVVQAVQQGYSGVESLSGIPGTVGGAVVANLGAYGTQLSDVLVSVKALDLHDPESGVQTFMRDDCDFSYHDSMFAKYSGRYVVLEAVLMLARDSSPDFTYKDHRFNFTDIMATEHLPRTPVGLRTAVLSIREKKGVLQTSYQSAGSFFHMLTVSEKQYTEITARAAVLNPQLEQQLRPWAWKQANGAYRVASAFLLEFTEFPKGFARGSVGVSPKHQLSIINLGGARASEIAELARDMRNSVKKLFGVDLEREVKYVGNIF